MNTLNALEVLSALFDLLEHPDITLSVTTRGNVRREAKCLAAKLVQSADERDLDTIRKCAAILDRHAPQVGPAKVRWAARSLDDHRAAIVNFCLDHTGPRLRINTDDQADEPTGLSVYEDHRPGWGDTTAQPAGLDTPTPWEIKRAQRFSELGRQLRDDSKQLPTRVRAALRDIRNRPTDNTPTVEERRVLQANSEYAAVYRAYRRRGKSHAHAYHLATTDRVTFTAEEQARDYARTRLGVIDHSAPPGTRVTLFDLDDQRAERRRRARTIRCVLCAHVRDDDDVTSEFDDRLCRECRNINLRVETTPCVWCNVERAYADHRGTYYARGHADGHDDGLCRECREIGRPGLLPLFDEMRGYVRRRAYMHTEDRAALTQEATAYARCLSVARYYGEPGAALRWLRAYYAIAPEAHRPVIAEWGTRIANHPQPPAPAPAAPARQLTRVA